jgi:hypothetical protein
LCLVLKKKGVPDELPAKKEDRPGRIEEQAGLISRSPTFRQKTPTDDIKSLKRFSSCFDDPNYPRAVACGYGVLPI